MINDKNLLSEIKEFDIYITTASADDKPLLGTHYGNIPVFLNGHKFTLTNVLYVPSLQDSLLSVSALTKENMTVTFNKNGEVNISKNDTIKSTTKSIGNSYKIHMLITNASSSEKELQAFYSDFKLRHNRLGHCSKEKLKLLFNDIQITDNDTCDICIKAKQFKQPFLQSGSRESIQMILFIWTYVVCSTNNLLVTLAILCVLLTITADSLEPFY
jgi:GAG-pre-integrase domain